MFNIFPISSFPTSPYTTIPKSPPLNPRAPIFRQSHHPHPPVYSLPPPAENYLCWAGPISRAEELILAIQHGTREQTISDIIQQCTPNMLNEFINNTNALMEAAKKNDVKLVFFLLQYRASPRLSNQFGQTPLLFAIRFGQTPPGNSTDSASIAVKQEEEGKKIRTIAQILIDYGSPVDPIDAFDSTPLQSHVNQFFPEQIDSDLIAFLIAEGADEKELFEKNPIATMSHKKSPKGSKWDSNCAEIRIEA